MRGRTITFTVTDKRGKASKTIPLYQYDYGQKLVFEGVELPEYYEVHFSNQMNGEAVTVLGDSTGVLIPDTLLETGDPIYVWLFLHDSSYDGETEYQGVIPIIKRAEPTDVTPTPEEQSIITEVIAALNNMEDDMSEQVEPAQAAREAAETAQTAAEAASATAVSASDAAGSAQTAAETAQVAAETAQAAAEAAQTAAESAYANADDARNDAVAAKIDAVAASTTAVSAKDTAVSSSGTAVNAANSAEEYKTGAEAAQTAAETAQGLAETAQAAAEAAESDAEAGALEAEGYALGKQSGNDVDSSSPYYHNNAKYYATQASDSATAAASSESDAEDSAEDAEAYAVGKRNGVDVDSDDPAYHNNAKYYAESMIGKADLVSDAVEGNFAGLDSDGNLTDSGSKPSDFLTEHQDISGKLDAPSTAGTQGQVLTSDGEGGQAWADPSGAIDDSAGEGDTDVTWSADKLVDEFGDVLNSIQGKYEKPSGGIPATDIAPGVIPTVPTVATQAQIKGGTDDQHPIAPIYQHESVFYAFAKLAGADMAQSSNPVGQFTDSAKTAIQKMLGIYESQWELIREDTVTNATDANIDITVDGNGNPFELTDVRLMFCSPVQETQFVKGDYGKIKFGYGTGSDADSCFIGAYTQAANASRKISYCEIEQKNGMIKKQYTQNATNGGNANIQTYVNDVDQSYFINPNSVRYYNKIIITNVTGTAKYKLYGKRKWN